MCVEAAKTGPVRIGLVGPKRPSRGIPIALARCIPPVSFVTSARQPANSRAKDSRSVFPARLLTRSVENPVVIRPVMAPSLRVPKSEKDSSGRASISARQWCTGQRFSGLFSEPGIRAIGRFFSAAVRWVEKGVKFGAIKRPKWRRKSSHNLT